MKLFFIILIISVGFVFAFLKAFSKINGKYIYTAFFTSYLILVFIILFNYNHLLFENQPLTWTVFDVVLYLPVCFFLTELFVFIFSKIYCKLLDKDALTEEDIEKFSFMLFGFVISLTINSVFYSTPHNYEKYDVSVYEETSPKSNHYKEIKTKADLIDCGDHFELNFTRKFNDIYLEDYLFDEKITYKEIKNGLCKETEIDDIKYLIIMEKTILTKRFLP